MFFRKLRNNVLQNRIEQLEYENKLLECKLQYEKEMSGAYLITLNKKCEQNEKLNKALENIMNRLNQANIRNIIKARKIEVNDDQSTNF